MKVFLTGATGYIGSAVAEALQLAGHDVLGLARSEEAARKLKEKQIETHRGDLSDAESVGLACHDADAVIHLACPGDATSERLDRILVDAVLDELEGTNKPFIYTSGVWVLGDTGDKVADENWPLSPTPLVAWRPAIEERVLKSVPDEVRSIVIRPALVYGRGGGIPAMLVGSARQGDSAGSVRFVGTGNNRWPTIHVEDLADLYLRALRNAPAGALLHGASGESFKVRDAALAVAEAAGVPGNVVSWPLEEARKTLGPFADALALDQQVSGDRARRLLDWRPSKPSILEDLRHGSYAAKARVVRSA
jgi:nucleoside-diphosphate-sugar epimerase